MALIAFVLGVVFFWLAELAWSVLSDGERQVCRAFGYVLVFLVFLATVVIFIAGIYGRLDGDREAWAVQAVDAAASVDIAGSFLGFAAGVFAVWQRARLKRLCQRVLSAMLSAPAPPAEGAREGGAATASPWLVGATGFSAIALAAILLILIYFPGHVTGALSSIKIGGVEAQFAASTHSAIVAIQADKSPSSNSRHALVKWAVIDAILDTYTKPAVSKVLANDDAAAQTQGDEKHAWVRKFLDAFAVPLSSAMRCVSDDPRYSLALTEATPLASQWKRFAEEILNQDQPTQTDKFDQLRDDFEHLVVSMDRNLANNHYSCDAASHDAAYFAGKHYLTAGMERHLRQIFTDGYVIAFIADLLSSTVDPGTALQYMNRAGKELDEHDDAIAGRYNFYSTRASARWQSDDWIFDDWILDVRQARTLAQRIVDAVEKSDPSPHAEPLGVAAYYRMLTANTINTLIYGYVRDWEQGRHRTSLALSEPETSAKELEKWLEEQPEAELLAALNQDSTKGVAFGRLILMGNSYDTLAMFELLSTQSRLLSSQSAAEPTREEHCERGLGLLNASKRILDELHNTLANQGFDDAYHEFLAAFVAHMNIYESICSPLTAE